MLQKYVLLIFLFDPIAARESRPPSGRDEIPSLFAGSCIPVGYPVAV